MAEETITQQPFTPLVQGGIPNAPGVAQLTPMDAGAQQEQTPSPLFNDQPGMSPQYMAQYNTDRQTQLAQANMDQVVKATQGFMPHFLATAAALKGNFGPAIALQQQKEQTAIGRAMIPVLANIKQLSMQGRFDEAYAAANQAASQAGDRAPEASRILQGAAAQIAKTQEMLKMTQNAADNMIDTVNIEAERTGTKPQDDIRYTQAKALLKAAKRGSYFDQSFINNQMVAFRPHTQVVNGAIVQSTEGSTAISQEPTQHFTQPSAFHNYIGFELGAKYKLTADQMANVLGGKPATAANGEVIQPGSAKATQLHEDYTALQPILGQIQIGEKIQLPPEINMQLLAGKEPPLNVLTKVFGSEKAPELAQALDEARKGRLAALPTRVALQEDPYLGARSGYVNLHVDPAHPDFLGEAGPMTWNEMQATGGKVIPVRTPVLDAEVKPALRAIQGLRRITTLFDSLGRPNTDYGKIVTSINRFASDWLGVDLTGEMGTTKAAQAIVNNSIEELEKTKLVPQADIGELKKYITGNFANEQAATRTIHVIQKRMDEYLTRAIGKKAITEKEALEGSGATQQQSAPSTVPIQAQPGTYSTVPQGTPTGLPTNAAPQGSAPAIAPAVQQPSLPSGWRRK